MGCARFPLHERRLLLSTPGLGEVVVGRLEAAGLASLRELQALGPEGVLEQVGQGAWRNRRRAFARALARCAPPLPAGAGAGPAAGDAAA